MAKRPQLISYEALLEAAADLRLALMKYAPYPAIAKIFSLGKVEKRQTGLSVGVVMDLSIPKESGGAPYARAFDKGSGIHGSKHKTYKIAPRNAAALAFAWAKGEKNLARLYASRPSKFLGRASNGRLAFTHVDHPGVKGTGYVKKAMTAARPEIVKTLKADVGNNARIFLRQVVREINQR